MNSATMPARRPLILVPARFSASASALRYGAIVTARALAEAVFEAGGEPVTALPEARAERLGLSALGERFGFVDGVLLPGGGDLSPSTYGQEARSAALYDVDADQDAVDLAVARWAVIERLPVLAICRGMQVVNVALGGTLEQDMPAPHRHTVQPIEVQPGSALVEALGRRRLEVSCFHHQRIERLADALRPVALAPDGTVEAAELRVERGFVLAVQWHPEDTAASDPANAALFVALVRAARSRLSRRRAPRAGVRSSGASRRARSAGDPTAL